MKLLTLEISGFKSFVDPVSLGFSPGITAIVGPNGCGKSNLADAMSWVLGEQSAKSLRSSTMDEMIFNGSKTRRPLGMAEVTITLETDPVHEAAHAASEDDRLTLSRRVFRSGESEYRINGRRARLKEIRDLLMGTGLGFRSYSIIEQGRIGMILSGKPQERRRLLEEAAGVTLYRQRKRLAEVKLEEATANLFRLDDITSEVERSVRSLKRQASAARRYQRRRDEYRALLERVLTGRWRRLSLEVGRLQTELAIRSAEEGELVAGLHRRDADLSAGREEADALAQELADRHARFTRLEATIEGRQVFLEGARHRLGELAERLGAGARLAEERRRARGNKEALLAELGERRNELLQEREESASAVAADDDSLAAHTAAVIEAEERLARLHEELGGEAERVEALARELHARQVESEKAGLRESHLQQELFDYEAELAGAREALEQGRRQVQDLEAKVTEREAGRDREVAVLDELLEEESARERRCRELDDQLAAAERRSEVLRHLDDAHDRSRQRIRDQLAARGVDEPDFLSDHLRARPGWEASLDFFFGTLADAVVVPEDRDALELARQLGNARTPVVLFQPPDEDGPLPPVPQDPAVLGRLSDFLDLPGPVAAALPAAFVVEAREDARRLAAAHRGLAFLSRDPLWASGGFLHVEGERGQPGVLERRQELRRLEGRQEELATEIEEARARLDQQVEARTRQAQIIHGLERTLSDLHRQLAVAQARREDHADRLRRLERERASYRREQEQLEEEKANLAGSVEEAVTRLAEERAAEARLKQAYDQSREQAEALRQTRENLRESGASRRGRLELLDERLRTHDQETERLRQEVHTLGEQLAQWVDEKETLKQRRAEIETEVAAAEEELAQTLELRATAESAVVEARERLEARRESLRRLESEARGAREEREGARAAVEELRIRLAGLRQDGQHLAETFAEHFDRPLPEEEGEVPEDLDDLEGELHRLKERLEAFGPVNTLAAEELDEQEHRHQELVEQRADVAASVEKLKRTIRELNLTSSQRLQATLEEVNVQFGATFSSLFGGGHAEIRLLDEEDILESGIEIVARPPGKRLQNLMLLSGGEKALTAIALLVALFRTKPSPFCILDEVDAPLDDANTLRFVEVVREMSADTQFVVITHNKLTMESAGTLYGVTMQERGVSKVVSVSLDEVQPLAPPAAQSA